MKRQEKLAAKLIALAELHRRKHIGIIRGDIGFAVSAWLVTIDVVLWQTLELFGIGDLDLFLIVGNVPLKHGLLIGELVVELL